MHSYYIHARFLSLVHWFWLHSHIAGTPHRLCTNSTGQTPSYHIHTQFLSHAYSLLLYFIASTPRSQISVCWLSEKNVRAHRASSKATRLFFMKYWKQHQPKTDTPRRLCTNCTRPIHSCYYISTHFLLHAHVFFLITQVLLVDYAPISKQLQDPVIHGRRPSQRVCVFVKGEYPESSLLNLLFEMTGL